MDVKYVLLDDVTFSDVIPYLDLLPKERREKIARYRFAQDKLTCAVAGLLIRQAIGDRELIFNEYRKPYIKDCDELFFSVSHSGRCVTIATDSVEVGIDVEQIRSKDIEKLADRFFSKGERKYISDHEDKQPLAFTEIWTRKEAYLKCKGVGITEDLSLFDTTGEELKTLIYSIKLGDCFLSVCSKKRYDPSDINISKIELKDVF